MRERGKLGDYDWWLLAITFAICGVGVLEIWSATHASHLAGMHNHQMEWILLGVGLMFLLSRVDYHTIMEQAPDPLSHRTDCFDRRTGLGSCPVWSQEMASHSWRVFAGVGTG